MALLKIGSTRVDRIIANTVAARTTPAVEPTLQTLTYAADEHLLLAVAVGWWLVTRASAHRPREGAEYLLLNVAISAALPHLLKRLVDQRRPDRKVYGRRHGIPFSGKADDAFPSGHAVHVGAIASAISRYFPEYRSIAWSIGAAVAVTRILLLAHWATDVIAGLALGAVTERCLWSWWRRRSVDRPAVGPKAREGIIARAHP